VTLSDDSPEDHARRPSLDAIELLTRIMRREGSDRSAHDVVRRNLARSEDLTLLTDLYDDARERIERSVGPDRRKAIAALEPRGNVVDATQHLRAAGDAIRRAEEQRSKAESRLGETEHEPIRTHLPGRLGEGSGIARTTSGEWLRALSSPLDEPSNSRFALTKWPVIASWMRRPRQARWRCSAGSKTSASRGCESTGRGAMGSATSWSGSRSGNGHDRARSRWPRYRAR